MHRMTLKRPAAMYAVLHLLVVLAVSFLFQVSDSSRPPSPEGPRTIPRPVLLRDGEPHVEVERHHRDNVDGTVTTRPAGVEMEAAAVGKKIKKAAHRADDDGGAGAASSAATTAPARDVVDHQVGSAGSTNLGGAGALMMKTTPMRPPVLQLRSELPRRVLAGAPPVVEGTADSRAKSSCQSGDVHVNCPPSRN